MPLLSVPAHRWGPGLVPPLVFPLGTSYVPHMAPLRKFHASVSPWHRKTFGVPCPGWCQAEQLLAPTDLLKGKTVSVGGRLNQQGPGGRAELKLGGGQGARLGGSSRCLVSIVPSLHTRLGIVLRQGALSRHSPLPSSPCTPDSLWTCVECACALAPSVGKYMPRPEGSGSLGSG